MTKTISAFAVVLLAMLAAQQLVAVQAAIECPQVVEELMPCLGYLQGNEESPSTACCVGARTLYAAADTREDRQETCKCLKAAFIRYHVLASAAQALPGKCHIGLSYPITPDIDCSQ